VKKRKENFMILTASTAEMDPRVLAVHNFYKVMILDEIDAKMATSTLKWPRPRHRHQL
jgi:hypothetical protein